MTDEPNDEDTKDAPKGEVPGEPGEHPIDGRYPQGNLANRLFPGPSQRMSKQFADRVEGLLKPLDNEQAAKAWRERRSKSSATGEGSRRRHPAVEPPSSPAPEPPTAATPEDIAQVRESLDKQNELLQAILASTVDSQTDARSTAQNSRTFAWAGTAIALLTLIATVISIVTAVRAP